MPKMKRDLLEVAINRANIRFGDLVSLHPPSEYIANFGCSIGHETFELMWSFNSVEVVGLDIELENITQAEEYLATIKSEVVECKKSYYLKWTSQEDRNWWNGVPPCLKDQRYPRFYHGDMTKRTKLADDYFDLAFCSNVLYHIDHEKLSAAISEMKRVVKPGGWVVAWESSQESPTDSTPLNFHPIFEQVVLKRNDSVYNNIKDSEGQYYYLRDH
jgi:ubiquinone/menaquinone biosynthesis C-methylase UbiE